MTNFNEKTNDIFTFVPPNNETDERIIEIEIKVIKKSCCVRYKRKISYCCKKFWKCELSCLIYLLLCIFALLFLCLLFYLGGRFIIVYR